MPTPGSKVCSASGWPMPRMKTLTLLAEPRPWTMLRLGTAPCRPVTSLACRLARSSSLKALTATGTSWIDSTRRRAVTVTASSVRASALSWVAGAAACVCCSTGSACCAQAAGDSRTQPIARLKCLRFIESLSLKVHAARHAPQIGRKPMTTPQRAASYLRTMGRRGTSRDTRPPRRPTPADGAMDVVRHRPRRAVLPDVRRLPRPQRDPVRADRGAGRGAAHRPVAGRADVHRPVHGQDGRLPDAVFPGIPAGRGVRHADRALRLLQGDRGVPNPILRPPAAVAFVRAVLSPA